jgi:sulfur-oxidizing protein SoxA
MKANFLWSTLIFAAFGVAADTKDFRPVSGYAFMEPATRDLQDDDFMNPAMFLVEAGVDLWDQPWLPGGATCRSCHQDIVADMRGVAARYPQIDADSGRLVSLEMKINTEIQSKSGGVPLKEGAQDLLALSALIGFQSRGMPMAVVVTPETQPWIDKGEQIFQTRRGQLNLSCANCHEDHWGEKLRGDTISQGHINDFPIYRLAWGEVGSRQRMFTWCMESVRSEPFAYGSDAFLALEIYLAVRGTGLLVETPGVRR